MHAHTLAHTQKPGMISTHEVDAEDHKFTVVLTQPGLCETLSQKVRQGAGAWEMTRLVSACCPI